MNAEEKQAMRDSIELAVKSGNEPIWDLRRAAWRFSSRRCGV